MKSIFARLFGLNSSDNKGINTLLSNTDKVNPKPKEKHFARNCKDEYNDSIKAIKQNVANRLKK
jgi:hypothetical protein